MENELVKVKDNEIVISEDYISKYREFKKLQLEMDLLEKEFKKELKSKMEELDIKEIIKDGFSAKIKNEYIRTSFDSKKFKEDYPEIYGEYQKETKVASSIAIEVV